MSQVFIPVPALTLHLKNYKMLSTFGHLPNITWQSKINKLTKNQT